MIPISVFSALAVILFLGAFLSKRRFGLLGLALAAGATLSALWTYDAGLVVSSTGLLPKGPVTQAVTQSLVVLLPAVLLLFHGATYRTKMSRLIGSFLFTVLAIAFLVEPIGYALPLEGFGATAYETIKQYKDIIISIGVVLAVVDLFFTKPTHASERGRHR